MPDDQNRALSFGRFSASLLPAAVVLLIEALRYSNFLPPIPFLLLFGSVIAAATIDRRRGALIGSAVAAGYILYAYSIGFGPPALVGSLPRTLSGITAITLVAALLAWLQERSDRLHRTLEAHANAHYEALIDNAPEAICLADPDGHVVRGNPKFHEMFGMQPGAGPRYTIADISADKQPDGRDSAAAACEHIRYALEKELIVFEWLHRRLNGEPFYAEVALSRLPSARGTFVRGAIRDITRRKRAELLLQGEAEALRLIANAEPLPDTLERLATLVESVLPESLCSILLLDSGSQRVYHVAAPSLSVSFRQAIDGLRIGPSVDSCVTAMSHGRTVITTDIETDPLWSEYRVLARPEGLRTCWPMPILDSSRNVLGCFAVYYRMPRQPSRDELDVLAGLRSIAGIAVERAHRSHALAHSEAIYRATFENAAVGMAHVSTEGRYLRVNEEFARLLGYSAEELSQLRFHDVTHPEDLEESKAGFSTLLAGKQNMFFTEKRWLRKDGKTVWMNISVGTVQDAEGNIERFVVVAQDISHARELSEKLMHEVRHDALTGLINRREFDRQLAEVLREVNQRDTVGAFLYIDLDQFKLVNDTAGHIAGDMLLQQLAPLLQRQVRSSDLVGRLGGDEFGVLLRNCSEEAMRDVAAGVLNVIQEFVFTWEEQNFRLSASIGGVQIEAEKFSSTSEILRIADTVCYAAKDAGRDRFIIWQEDDDRLHRRHGEMQWVPRIISAIEAGDLCFVGQPIIGVAAREEGLFWFELLIRLRDNGRSVLPGAFMPAIERYAVAPKVDRLVIKTAIDWLKRNSGAHVNPRLSINLSGASLNERGFVGELVERLDDLGQLAQSLCFEITETVAISNLAEATALIETARALGCRFALDDFGSGLSSFSYLKNLPVDYLKIDGSFIRDLVRDPTDAAVVRAINEVGRSMRKQMIAEFVESEEILAALRDMGVDYAQGFHIGRPRPLDELSIGPIEAGTA
jgi:diguanylate cyclase (GGDEF)-like protein/PAS domain S-box-containing protein